MKKILVFSILTGLLVAPVALFAETITTPDSCRMKREIKIGTDITCPMNQDISIGGDQGYCCVLNTLYNITDWIFVVLVILASLFVALGAWFFLTSAGNPEGTTKGRLYILYAAIGLAVAFVAKAIPGLVRLIISAK